MTQKKDFLLTVLFWGSAWGMVEATLGWGFHKLYFHGGSNILYTLGMFCMLSCSSRTGKGAKAAMATAVVASAIKLLDLFLPMTFRGAIHPALYILLEGAMIAVLCSMFSIKTDYSLSVPRLERRMAIPTFTAAALLTLWLG
jgi:hypothetical protein